MDTLQHFYINGRRVSPSLSFGRVLTMIPCNDVDEAMAISNDTVFGLSGYVSGDPAQTRAVANRLRTGNVHLNGAGPDFMAAFGGYRHSGVGRKWGRSGLDEFLEIKSLFHPA